MANKKLIVIGGGAAGFFCAVNAARMNPELEIFILEKSNKLLVFKINNNNIFTYNVPSNFEFKTIGFPINGGTEYIVDYINILYK